MLMLRSPAVHSGKLDDAACPEEHIRTGSQLRATSGNFSSRVQVHQRLDKLDADFAAMKKGSADEASQTMTVPSPAAPT